MRNYIKIDSSLLKLFNLVREDRKAHKICLSAQDGIDINACLQEIIDKDIYKQDYETITKPLIFEDVSYETVKTNLQEIINKASA